uniref:Expansin-like EG45 domain-containing protein n=1 Tax=Globodera pallida TaxID=36090 RepID=A0A183BRT1_GLOPA
MAPLPTLFALLCCIAALVVVRCDGGVECKVKTEDKDGNVLSSTDSKWGCKNCFTATCTGETAFKGTAIINSFPTNSFTINSSSFINSFPFHQLVPLNKRYPGVKRSLITNMTPDLSYGII